MQSSCPVVPPKTKTKQSKRKPGTGAPAPSWPNTREFSVCRNDPGERRHRSPRCSKRLREKARGRLRLPAPLLRGKATPQLCARAARSGGSSSASSPAAAGLPLCWRAAQEAEEGGARRRPPGKRARGRAPRGRPSPGGGGRALPPPPALGPRPPAPAAAGPATLFRESRPSRLRFGPGPAQAATAGWAPGTWRPGSPDRAPRQSAPAPRSLPARSGRPGARLAWGCAPRAAPRAGGAPGARNGCLAQHHPLYSDYPNV